MYAAQLHAVQQVASISQLKNQSGTCKPFKAGHWYVHHSKSFISCPCRLVQQLSLDERKDAGAMKAIVIAAGSLVKFGRTAASEA